MDGPRRWPQETPQLADEGRRRKEGKYNRWRGIKVGWAWN